VSREDFDASRKHSYIWGMRYRKKRKRKEMKNQKIKRAND